MQTLLVVEDDAKTADTVALYLRHAGYRVSVVHDGASGLERARTGGYDLVVLDVMLPRMDGLEVCRALREESGTPVIMLTARTTEADRVGGLDLGADDYVAKPFSPRELVARVRAVLRRAPGWNGERDAAVYVGDLCLDPAAREVRVGDRRVSLTPSECRLLETLLRAPRRVFSRAELSERLPGGEATGRVVDAHVKNLRTKIEPDRARPQYIQTVFGVGYRFGGRPSGA